MLFIAKEGTWNSVSVCRAKSTSDLLLGGLVHLGLFLPSRAAWSEDSCAQAYPGTEEGEKREES